MTTTCDCGRLLSQHSGSTGLCTNAKDIRGTTGATGTMTTTEERFDAFCAEHEIKVSEFDWHLLHELISAEKQLAREEERARVVEKVQAIQTQLHNGYLEPAYKLTNELLTALISHTGEDKKLV